MSLAYYVYMYCDPLKDNEPFYIGKGVGNRKNKHLYETRDNTENVRKFNRIQSIKSANINPVVVVVCDCLTENDAYELEMILIRYFGRMWYDNDGILTNVCIDARPPGMSGKRHTVETKQIIKSKMQSWVSVHGNPMQGRNHSATSRLLMSKKKTELGSTITETGREAISKTSSKRNKGKGNPMFGRKRKAMYNPKTLECRYVDVTTTTTEVDSLLLAGWMFGLLRSTKK